jgi:hypothetical protein
MIRLLPLVAFLAGCPSPGLSTGITGVISQEGYTCNTSQRCEHAAIATQIADRALLLSLTALVESGHVKDYSAAVKDATKVSVCIVRDPEPCAFAGWTAGPCNPALKRCARKRGCASAWHAWASICWPPVCRPDWPDEPHCVPAGGASTSGWEQAFVHEIFNTARARWAVGPAAYEGDYSKLPALFGAGGVESRVMTAYGAPRHHITGDCR